MLIQQTLAHFEIFIVLYAVQCFQYTNLSLYVLKNS